jgi:hypothetical protein
LICDIKHLKIATNTKGVAKKEKVRGPVVGLVEPELALVGPVAKKVDRNWYWLFRSRSQFHRN